MSDSADSGNKRRYFQGIVDLDRQCEALKTPWPRPSRCVDGIGISQVQWSKSPKHLVALAENRHRLLRSRWRSCTHRPQLEEIEKGENVGVDEVHKLAFALGFTLALSESIRPTWENARSFFMDEDDE